MIVEWHDCAFLNEEHDQAVVVVSFYSHFVELVLEVIAISKLIVPRNAKRVQINRVHLSNYFLAHGIL